MNQRVKRYLSPLGVNLPRNISVSNVLQHHAMKEHQKRWWPDDKEPFSFTGMHWTKGGYSTAFRKAYDEMQEKGLDLDHLENPHERKDLAIKLYERAEQLVEEEQGVIRIPEKDRKYHLSLAA